MIPAYCRPSARQFAEPIVKSRSAKTPSAPHLDCGYQSFTRFCPEGPGVHSQKSGRLRNIQQRLELSVTTDASRFAI